MQLLKRDIVCQQAVELMSDYLEGALTRRQRHRLERHLRTCPNCRAYLEQMRITIEAMGRADPEPLDDATRADLIDLFNRYHDRPPDP